LRTGRAQNVEQARIPAVCSTFCGLQAQNVERQAIRRRNSTFYGQNVEQRPEPRARSTSG